MREVLGRKGATMGLLRAARGAGARAPPRRGWPLSENGDGRLLNRKYMLDIELFCFVSFFILVWFGF